MNKEQNQKNLVDTTDCLEAVGVFRGWKNFLFVIVICCLLLQQATFWLVHSGFVKSDTKAKAETSAASKTETKSSEKNTSALPVLDETVKIENAAEQVTLGSEQPTVTTESPVEVQQQQSENHFLNITEQHISLVIRFLNFILISAATLHCLTMLFILKISLLGRIGGINHISRAFFLSLLMLFFLLPWWQHFFPNYLTGVMFTPEQLLRQCSGVKERAIVGTILFYLRFVAYWLLVVWLLLSSQVRSARWAKATLRRLEII